MTWPVYRIVEIWIWSKSVFTRHKQKKAIKKTKENVSHLNISRLQPWDAIKISQTNLQWLKKTLNEESCHPINANWRKWRMFENFLLKKTLLHFNFFQVWPWISNLIGLWKPGCIMVGPSCQKDCLLDVISLFKPAWSHLLT